MRSVFFAGRLAAAADFGCEGALLSFAKGLNENGNFTRGEEGGTQVAEGKTAANAPKQLELDGGVACWSEHEE